MLIRHSVLYLSGRIIPGAVSLLALAIYTRLLTGDEYGRYALVIAAASVANATGFHWLSLSLDRFYPLHAKQPQELFTTTVAGFLAMAAITGILGGSLAWLWHDENLRWLIFLAVVIVWAQAWFDINSRIAIARLAPVQYGLLSSLKGILALAAGTALFYLGLGVPGILLGLLLGLLLATLPAGRNWQDLNLRHYDAHLFRELASYGSPVALAIMLTTILDVSDRFLLGWLIDAKAAGAYAAAYDLAQQSLGTLMGVVHLAGFPLAVRALEESGMHAARDQLQQNAFVSLSVALPATVGTILLSDNIAYTLLGSEFRAAAGRLIPLIAIAVFLWGAKIFYFDYAFQLTRRTKLQLWPVAVAAIINICLNCVWIPEYGLVGAAFATLAAFIVGLGLAWYLGKRIFTYPRMHRELYKVVVASSGMAGVLLLSSGWRGAGMLMSQIAIGLASYATVLVALDTHRTGTRLKAWVIRSLTG